MASIFGFNITRDPVGQSLKSFVPPTDDGTVDTPVTGASHYGTYIDIEGAAKTESEHISRYRQTSQHADVDSAIEDIVNEAIANLDGEDPITIDLDEVEQSEDVKKEIEIAFEEILDLLDFDNRAQDYFRRWYIDGRLYFHKIPDPKNPQAGISSIRYIDPRKIKKVREVKKEKDKNSGVEFIVDVDEYFVFNDRGHQPKVNGAPSTVSTAVQPLKIQKDAIAFVPSGLVDLDTNMILSYLHKAVKPANQLRMMENALVIYRLARAPERRIFYIDVGNLPKAKAEQYLKDVVNRYRNKLVYDGDTGTVRDDKKTMSMLEDIWLPRREGGKGTQIETLPGGQNLGQIQDVEYFKSMLYQALNVPLSRLQPGSGLNFGKAAEITRDELKFTKFIGKLRRKFVTLFDDLLKTHLMLKKVIVEDDWDAIRKKIQYNFATDAYYTESKEQEIMRARFELLQLLTMTDGKYVSTKYIQKKILRMTDEEIAEVAVENAEQAVQHAKMDMTPGAEVDQWRIPEPEPDPKPAPITPKKK